jgi:hypothetical protein
MKLHSRGRYAAVASTAALVVALGGTSYAVSQVTGHDIKNGTVTTKDVKNHNLRLKDLSSGARAGLRGATGATGQTGPTGPIGPANIFEVYNDDSSGVTVAPKTVLSLALQAGTYDVTAMAEALHFSGTTSYVECDLNGAGQTAYSAVTPRDTPNSVGMLPSELSLTTGTATTVTLDCRTDGGSNIVDYKRITAIQVGTLTRTQGQDVSRVDRFKAEPR